MIEKDLQIKESEVYTGEHFQFRLTKEKKEKWVEKLKNSLSPDLFEKKIQLELQKSLRKHDDSSVDGVAWENDLQDIFTAVMEDLKQE